MLGQVANYCPIISRNTIVKTSTSLAEIWQTIRLHFGFQSSGAHFRIRLQDDEEPEDLYQRLVAFLEDLLKHDGGITHHGENLQDDEELTPSLENIIVLTWLRLIHPPWGPGGLIAPVIPNTFYAISMLSMKLRLNQ